jgi:hypothetical protein
LLIGAAIFWSLGSDALVRAEELRIADSGRWTVTVVTADVDRSFAGCEIREPATDGLSIGFALARDRQWQLMLFKPGGFRPGQLRRMQILVDGDVLLVETVSTGNDGVGRLKLPDRGDVIGALRAGRKLEVVTERGRSTFDLRDSSAAIADLWRCVEQHSQPIEETASLPADTREASDASKLAQPAPQNLSTAELLEIVGEIAKATGRTDYRMLPDEDTGDGTVAWQYQSTGGVVILTGLRSARQSLAELAAASIGGLTKECEGVFVATKEPAVFELGAEMVRGKGVCQTADGAITHEVVVARRADGEVWRIIASEALAPVGEGEPSQPTIDAAFTQAVHAD